MTGIGMTRPNKGPWVIRGVAYSTQAEAAKALGVTRGQIIRAFSLGRQDNVGLGLTAAMPVKIRGVVYPSAGEAARALGVNRSVVAAAVAVGREDFIGVGTGATMATPVTIRGREYPSINAAARALNLHRDTVSRALETGRLDKLKRGRGVVDGPRRQYGGRPRKPVTLAGVEFPSMNEAARALGIESRYFRMVMASGGDRARARLQRIAEEYRDKKLAELLDQQVKREREIRAERLGTGLRGCPVL